MTTEVRTARQGGGARPCAAAEPARLRWTPSGPLHLGQTLRVLGRGGEDPTLRVLGEDCVWLTTRCRGLPVSARFSRAPLEPGANPLERDVLVAAWGPGARQWLPSAPRWVGEADTWHEFESSPAFEQLPHALRRARHTHPGMRLTATGAVLDRAVVAILEQRVTALEAVRAHRALLRWIAEPAPGPAPHGMRVPPTAEQWRRVPSWRWHRAGVDPARSATVMRTVHRAPALERLALDPDPARVRAALQSIGGIGPWTAAEITQCTHGDPDGVSVFDYHLADHVCWFFDGAPGSDERMLELLEPWRGHRQRVVRLLMASGHRKPSFGPRLSPQDHRHH
ncbi:DNA-3-methyladenine glycosylase family protein [Kocuria tytonis]|uniref:DNA-3-methyladenine glycosylase 2 family protein n=1 Tax=Kocuria tytonis TaxID=2054280 RepID=A0A495ABQ2_9MICC|nr:hypothetical protein [Kocuria tytonis]RKQ36980.1 hypothetical protein C1C97_005130 [Kocuria tytonis]